MNSTRFARLLHGKRAQLLTIFLLLFGLTYSTVSAQDLDDATISGRVIDQNGATIQGASVTVQRVSAATERTTATDEAGRFRFVELEPGTYTLRAQAGSFAATEVTLQNVLAGQTAQLDITLRPSVSDEVTVTIALPPVDTTRTIVGGTVTTEEIEALPNVSRSPLELVFTLPGVTEPPFDERNLAEDRNTNTQNAPEETGLFSLSGGAPYSNNITIDGFDNNDDRAARERFQPSLEAVAEVQVITNQFSAEYGRASGGRVNIRTRAGTNRFRGRAFYFFRDESLNANSYYNNARGLNRLPLQEHNPGFTISGPLNFARPFSRRNGDANRTQFFIGYEYQTILDSVLIDTLVPVAANPRFSLPQPTTLAGSRTEAATETFSGINAELAPFVESTSTPLRNHTFTWRIDRAWSERHTGAALLQIGRARNLRGFGGGSRLAETLQARTRHSDALAYTDNFVFSNSVINQLRVQVSRLTPATLAPGNAPVVLIRLNDPLASGDFANRDGTLVAGTSTLGATDRRESRFQIQDSLSVVRGAHALKFGADFQRIRSTFIDLTDASGTFEFDSASDFLADAPSSFRQSFGGNSTLANTYAAIFAQDEWRVRPNLVLTFGLRYENETIIRDRNNFAPRLALAYDPFRSGKTVVRLGAGMFYNRALLRTIDDFTLGAGRLVFDTDNLRDLVSGGTLTAAQRQAFIQTNLRFPDVLPIDSPLATQYGLRKTDFIRRLDSELRIPESYQFNVGVEREIGSRFVVEANYTFNRGLHLWREFNANAPRLPDGYKDFTQYLLSRDFANFRDRSGVRPLYNAASAGEIIRFRLAPPGITDANAVARTVEAGVPITLFNLDSVSSTTALRAALGALNDLRPDPQRGQIEQLVSAGNSFYHGLTIEARRRFAQLANGFGVSVRGAYTLSRTTDDGVVNTSSALRAGDFAGERALSLLDRRHRFVFSGVFDVPRYLGGVRLAPVVRVASGAPFNLSIGGVDRNLDDVNNDRPLFNGDPALLRVRRPGEPISDELLTALSLPLIGSTGNLPRNAGRGPGLFAFDINITREFRFRERLRLRPTIEIDNVLNRTTFSFGSEFINFNQLRPTSSSESRAAFLDTFLVPSRTLRARTVRLGVRFDF